MSDILVIYIYIYLSNVACIVKVITKYIKTYEKVLLPSREVNIIRKHYVVEKTSINEVSWELYGK